MDVRVAAPMGILPASDGIIIPFVSGFFPVFTGKSSRRYVLMTVTGKVHNHLIREKMRQKHGPRDELHD
jgi:hypothetical protein